jgi:hypothetical protein
VTADRLVEVALTKIALVEVIAVPEAVVNVSPEVSKEPDNTRLPLELRTGI